VARRVADLGERGRDGLAGGSSKSTSIGREQILDLIESVRVIRGENVNYVASTFYHPARHVLALAAVEARRETREETCDSSF
jgi:hypothetical protein